jgi:hypothetical protein
MATTADIAEAVGAAFDGPLRSIGFERVAPRRWVRSDRLPIRDLFVVGSLKSGMLTPLWGISLDFVPHISGRKAVRWHRTAQSADFDLRFDPVDVYERNTPAAEARCVLPAAAEPTAIADALKKVAHVVVPEAVAFWKPLRSGADLPSAFREKQQRKTVRFGFWNYIQEPLAEAFVHAALGNPSSVSMLDRYVDRFRIQSEPSDRLRRHLHELLGKGQQRSATP